MRARRTVVRALRIAIGLGQRQASSGDVRASAEKRVQTSRKSRGQSKGVLELYLAKVRKTKSVNSNQ